MKKLYNYLLPVMLACFTVACDDDEPDTVVLPVSDPVPTVASISPTRGYVGNEFTVTGTDFGTVKEHIVAKLEPNTTLLVSSVEDGTLTLKVPEGATGGKFSLTVYGMTVKTDFLYDVLGAPGITLLSRTYGFVGDTITFTGHDLGVSSALYKVVFAGMEEPVDLLGEPENTGFAVKVAEAAQSGEIALEIAGQQVNVSDRFTVLQHATLDTLLPAKGFAGARVVIQGDSLNPMLLTAVEDLPKVKVKLAKKGDVGQPVEATLDSQFPPVADSIVVHLPADLTEGEYVVSVSTPFETIARTLTYTVLPEPVVSSLAPIEGYLGATVTISGLNFGTSTEGITVKFGDVSASEVGFDADGNITAKVPTTGVTAGEVTVSLEVMGQTVTIPNATFNVLTTPRITSVIAGIPLNDTLLLVKAGATVTIAGEGFGTTKDNVEATFGGVSAPVTIETLADNQMTLSVPADFTKGKITLRFEGIDVPVESSVTLIMFTEGMDVSEYFLKNYKHEFKVVKGTAVRNGEWHMPQDWKVENVSADGQLTGVQYKNKNNEETSLAMQTAWGFPQTMANGKIWQTTTLPAGRYKLTVNVREMNISGTSHVVVSEGEEIPNSDNVANGLAYVQFTGAGLTSTPEFTLDQSKIVSLGFVSTINYKERYIKIESFKLELMDF